MSVSQVLCPECGASIPIKPGRRTQKIRCPACGERLDVDLRPGPRAGPAGLPPAVGSGVASFEGATAGELATRRKRGASTFGGGEIGGVGDLIFNPTGGQPAAMNALGSGGSLCIALVLFVLVVAFGWFLPLFSLWFEDPEGWTMVDVIRDFPAGAHVGLVALAVLPPLVLFGIFLVPHVLFFRVSSGAQLFLSTMLVFVPFLVLFAVVVAGSYYEETVAELAKSLNEVFGDGILTGNEGYNVRIALWFVGLVVLYTLIHPILLVYATLRTVVGFSDRGAFFLTPLVIGATAYLVRFLYWLAFEKLNLFGLSDALLDAF